MWRFVRILNSILAFFATLAPMAHVLELANKLSLDGPQWLAVQRSLYRGWGPVFGTAEILALATSLAFSLRARQGGTAYLLAAICYAAMIAVFFVFNNPVNHATLAWTAPAMLPADWSQYRLKWEAGHALAAVLSLVAFVAILRARESRNLAA